MTVHEDTLFDHPAPDLWRTRMLDSAGIIIPLTPNYALRVTRYTVWTVVAFVAKNENDNSRRLFLQRANPVLSTVRDEKKIYP